MRIEQSEDHLTAGEIAGVDGGDDGDDVFSRWAFGQGDAAAEVGGPAGVAGSVAPADGAGNTEDGQAGGAGQQSFAFGARYSAKAWSGEVVTQGPKEPSALQRMFCGSSWSPGVKCWRTWPGQSTDSTVSVESSDPAEAEAAPGKRNSARGRVIAAAAERRRFKDVGEPIPGDVPVRSCAGTSTTSNVSGPCTG